MVVAGSTMNVGRVWRGTAGPDGTVYLVVNDEKTVLVLSADGNVRGTMGRAGQGPGDFRSIQFLGFVGDTVWLGDPVLQRVTLYTAAGRLVGTRRVENLSYPKEFPFRIPKANAIYPRALYPDGTLLVEASVYSLHVPPTSAVAPGIPLLAVSPNGAVFAFDDSAIWVTEPDSDDVLSVVRYRWARSTAHH